jgi:site-specific recombinase XerD
LYLLQGKGQKQRYVYISSEIVEELESYDWKPNQTNRRVFWEFLNRIRQDLQIGSSVELAPHTLRRCFATYNLIAGMPLNILQKVLGHGKVSTTALYIKDSDLANLLKFKPI